MPNRLLAACPKLVQSAAIAPTASLLTAAVVCSLALLQLVEEDEGMKQMSAELAHIKTAANMQVCCGSSDAAGLRQS